MSHRHTRHVIHIRDGWLMVERCRRGIERRLATWCVVTVEVAPTLMREDGLVAAILALAALVIGCLLGGSIKRTTQARLTQRCLNGLAPWLGAAVAPR